MGEHRDGRGTEDKASPQGLELDQLGTLVGAMVHELKGPLQVLSMAMHTLSQRLEHGEPVAPSSIERALRQLRRLSRLVDDLGDAGRLTGRRATPSLAWFNVQDLVRAALGEVPPTRRADVTLRLPDESVTGWADAARLGRIVVTLLERATRLAREGTSIDVALVAVEGRAVPSLLLKVTYQLESPTAAGGSPGEPSSGRLSGQTWHNAALPLLRALMSLQLGELRIEAEETGAEAALLYFPKNPQ